MSLSYATSCEETELVGLLSGCFRQFEVDRLHDREVPHRLWEEGLLGPARELLSRKGKEFRRRLVESSYGLSGGAGNPPPNLGLLVEVLHAGSLVIDDIEDGSTSRRGRPSLHTLYGVPIALNMGNWLYFLASYLLGRLECPASIEVALTRELSKTMLRCHQGQSLDLSVRVGTLARAEIGHTVLAVSRLKTGALLEFASRLGSVYARAEDSKVEALARFAESLGVGLQMFDDWGGLANPDSAHKGHEDLVMGRATWPWVWLSERLDELSFHKYVVWGREVARGSEQPDALARALREELDDEGAFRARTLVRGAFEELSMRLGPSPLLEGIGDEIARLEKSYVR